MRRAVVYLRVSTLDQTTANQERELRQVAERMGGDIVKVYKDHGISGAKGRDKRPQFDALCRDATKRQFDVIMAWSVGRLRDPGARPRSVLGQGSRQDHRQSLRAPRSRLSRHAGRSGLDTRGRSRVSQNRAVVSPLAAAARPVDRAASRRPLAPHMVRLNLMLACARQAVASLEFWVRVRDGKDENGKPLYSEAAQLRASENIVAWGLGRPAQAVQVDQTSVGVNKVIHEVRWLPPDPNDHSNIIEPEPCAGGS